MIKKQQKIISDLNGLIGKYRLRGKLTPDSVIDWVWNSNGSSGIEASNAYQKKCFTFFRNVHELDEMNRILQIFVNVWNYFPHKDLDGKSPNQKAKEIYGSDKKMVSSRKSNNESMPKVICGGREFTWGEYQAMLKECERAQKPFRIWVEQEVIPTYSVFLQKQYKSQRVKEKHERVADIFFERALHLGFVTPQHIHAKFVWNDFPVWWQTHVMDDHQTEDQIRNSLVVFSEFLSETYDYELPLEEVI